MVVNECVYFKAKDVTLRLDKDRIYYPVYDYYCSYGGYLTKINYPLLTCNNCIDFKKK